MDTKRTVKIVEHRDPVAGVYVEAKLSKLHGRRATTFQVSDYTDPHGRGYCFKLHEVGNPAISVFPTLGAARVALYRGVLECDDFANNIPWFPQRSKND